MKKTVMIIIASAAALAIAAVGFALSRKPQETKQPETRAVQRRAEFSDEELRQHNWHSFREKVTELESRGDRTTPLDIPLYSAEDLLFDGSGSMIIPGMDAGRLDSTNARVHSSEGLYLHYPANSLRYMEDGTVYAVYDLDNGYRLYLFFTEEWDYSVISGYPLIIGDVHKRSDFAELKPGDSIDLVIRTDPAAAFTKEAYCIRYGILPEGVKEYARSGYPISSIHYLEDGILLIKYDMEEQGELIVSEIVYSSDYTLTDPSGNIDNYRVIDIDLP